VTLKAPWLTVRLLVVDAFAGTPTNENVPVALLEVSVVMMIVPLLPGRPAAAAQF
jgi:hypothetical protein